MLFNSYSFVLVFLPVLLWLWWAAGLGVRQRLMVLVAASYLFYGMWDWRFLGLLAGSTLIDYVAGGRLAASCDPAARRGWLLVSVAVNLTVLGVFKYAGFAAQSFNAIADWLQAGGRLPLVEIVLPVGISFYTFQTMSYSIDLYRGVARPAASIWHFAAYVSMFPQLIAGPIVRYGDVDDQLQSIADRIDWRQFGSGVWFFVAGMVQKVLLADTIAAHVDPLWADVASLRLATAWFAVLGYTVQLYFDFAGYSNMAVGLGRMLGFEFCQNFDSPYRASTIQAFWRRWHISLSQLLRDYLFIPLGGNRRGPLLTFRNLVVVMLLGGLWHGAGWTFVLWGAYHGLLLAVHAVWRQRAWQVLPAWCGTALTFASVVWGWVLFRAASWDDAARVYAALLGAHGREIDPLTSLGGLKPLAVLVLLLGIVLTLPNLWRIPVRLNALTGGVAAVLLLVCLLRFDSASPFLYFQF
jgi:alginate O-acetyltransferase complex protein AlgI